jgi:hypothetical protein
MNSIMSSTEADPMVVVSQEEMSSRLEGVISSEVILETVSRLTNAMVAHDKPRPELKMSNSRYPNVPGYLVVMEWDGTNGSRIAVTITGNSDYSIHTIYPELDSSSLVALNFESLESYLLKYVVTAKTFLEDDTREAWWDVWCEAFQLIDDDEDSSWYGVDPETRYQMIGHAEELLTSLCGENNRIVPTAIEAIPCSGLCFTWKFDIQQVSLIITNDLDFISVKDLVEDTGEFIPRSRNRSGNLKEHEMFLESVLPETSW